MEKPEPNNLAADSRPYSLLSMALLVVFSAVALMFGPAITTFLALGWPNRPGARVLLIVGIIFIVLHLLLMIAALSLPTFLPWLYELLPGMGKTRY